MNFHSNHGVGFNSAKYALRMFESTSSYPRFEKNWYIEKTQWGLGPRMMNAEYVTRLFCLLSRLPLSAFTITQTGESLNRAYPNAYSGLKGLQLKNLLFKTQWFDTPVKCLRQGRTGTSLHLTNMKNTRSHATALDQMWCRRECWNIEM